MRSLIRFTSALAVIAAISAGSTLRPGLGNQASAQDALRPAAVVNDEVISVLDLIMRVRLAILGAGAQDTPEMRNRFARQVLRLLVDERLQVQEANRLDIVITDEQVDRALGRIAEQNSLTRPQFMNLLSQRQILPYYLEDQIRAQLAWQTLVQRRLRPDVSVTPAEVDEIVNRITTQRGGEERRVSEIFLGVASADHEEDAFRNAQRIYEEIRNGSSFAGLARQFSQSSSAEFGGDLGWIPEGELPEEVETALSAMLPGDVSPPIRTLSGFVILLLSDQRQLNPQNVDRDRIQQSLVQQRLNRLAQRELQELRRAANIDIRL